MVRLICRHARGRALPATGRRRHLCFGPGRRGLLVLAFVLAALLSALAAPEARAHDDDVLEDGLHWDGTVEVSTTTLTIREGTHASYSVKLSHDPIYYRHTENDGTELVPCADDDPSCEWWVFVHVGNLSPIDDGEDTEEGYDLNGDGEEDLRFVPSLGREFDRSDYSQWKNITIHAQEDDDTQDQTVTFTHEVWGDDSECPIHQVGRVTVRIIDNDGATPPPPSSLSISDTTVTEGTTAEFRVMLSPAKSETVTVDYEAHQMTASAGQDFSGTSGTLTFSPNQTVKRVRVNTIDDSLHEAASEYFTVQLSNARGATLGDAVGRGTITDNDPRPTLSITDDTVTEGQRASFTVTLTGQSAQTVTVSYGTANDSATAGTDYRAESGTLSFASGTTTTAQTIHVDTIDDGDVESGETFRVVLSGPNGATLNKSTGFGTITDNDVADPTLPTLSITDETVVEGETAQFTVTLSGDRAQPVTVSYETEDDTATAGEDYESVSSTLTFSAGSGTAQRTIDVVTTDDGDDENSETYRMLLSTSDAVTLSKSTGFGTITDNDGNNDGPDPNRDGSGNRDGSRVTNSDGNDRSENWKAKRAMEARVASANRTLLPEIGRAVAFDTVRCRIEQAFTGRVPGGEPAGARPTLSLAPAAAVLPPADAGMPDPERPLVPVPDDPAAPGGGGLTLEQVLDDASFVLPLIEEDAANARLATWGCGEIRDLSGGEDGTGTWNGDAFSMQVGVDARLRPDLLAGVAFSRSGGSFEYAGLDGNAASGGEYELSLTGVHPYVGVSLSSGLEMWGSLGVARGNLTVTDDKTGTSPSSAATLTTGTLGLNGRLLAHEMTTVRLKGELSYARLDARNDTAPFSAAKADLQRLRLATEVSHTNQIPYVGLLVPWGEVGLRHDGGDGETGAGVEFGGGLRFRNIEQGWVAELSGRVLAVQQDALPEERGYAARFRYDPDAFGFGPWVGLSQNWGQSASEAHRLWEEDPTALTPHDSLARRLESEFGYGFATLGGRGVLSPFGALSLDEEHGRGYRAGSRLALGPSLSLSLEAERRDSVSADEEPQRTVMLRSDARF